jgi:putative two-component system response regulator
MGERTMLIVDDTPENIAALSAVLSGLGKVKAATSGEKGLKICGVEPRPDIVFLDISMPGMDGFEVCERLKAEPSTAAIPVIFVTGTVGDEDRRRSAGLGAAGLLTKPLDALAIKALVEGLLP